MREASTAPFAFYSIPRVKLYMHTLAYLGYIWLLVRRRPPLGHVSTWIVHPDPLSPIPTNPNPN